MKNLTIPKAALFALLYIFIIKCFEFLVSYVQIFFIWNYDSDLVHLISTSLGNGIVFSVTYYFLKKKKLINSISFNQNQIKNSLIAILVSLLFLLALMLFNGIVLKIIPFSGIHFDHFLIMFDIIPGQLLLLISYELFFRCFIQKIIQVQYSKKTTIISVAFLYAFTSLNLLSFTSLFYISYSFILTLFLGIISGLLYDKSKSILPSIIFIVFYYLFAITI